MSTSIESQDVLTPLTAAAIFLVVTVDHGAEDDVRDLLADVAGLTRSVGFRVPDGELTCVVGIGSDLWDRHVRRATAGGPAPVPRAGRCQAHRRLDAGRPALPPARAPDGPVLRAGRAADEPAGRARAGRRRGARLQVLRRARPAGVRRRHREPDRRGSHARRHDRRGGSGVHRRQLRHRPEVPARPDDLERAVGRGAGARHRADEAQRHRAARRGQAGELTRRAQHDHRRRRRGAADRARQHAVRPGRRGRVRHLLHRLLGNPGRDRADAAEHVHRQPARHLRPDPRLLDGGDRQPLLRAERGLPRRSTRSVGDNDVRRTCRTR